MGEIADLRECAPKYGNEMAVYKALNCGKIGTLVEVLVELKEGTLADQVCKTGE